MIKKILLPVILLLVFLTGTVFAKPVVTADKTYFDVTTGLYNLVGNVYVQVGSRIITAGEAKVNMATMEVSGSGGVAVSQDDIKFKGDSVFVSGAQNKADISGNTLFVRGDNLKISADQVSFNWKTKLAVFSGNVQVTQNNNTQSFDTVTYNVDTNSFL